MSLSRRQFFRRFWHTGEKPASNPNERSSRYEALETYARTHLLPYDFSLSADQEAELFSELRSALEKASDDELFSVVIRGRIEEVVEMKLQPWREQNRLRYQSDRAKEIRGSAADYVGAFLSVQATPAAIESLKQRFGTADIPTLEAELRKRIEAWLTDVEDEQLLQYDVFTAKDMVFAQLRSWC